jgi:hypothetical protein
MKTMERILGVSALALAGGAVAASDASADYYYCYGWPLNSGQSCRAVSSVSAFANRGVSHISGLNTCVNLQYWNGSWQNYYSWTCSTAAWVTQYESYTTGYPVVKNGSSQSGSFDGYVFQ